MTLARRFSALAIALALLTLVACDLAISGFRHGWDQHALTGSVTASLLVLGVTALIVDDVVARRGERERATSVSVQGVILYA